MWELQGFSYENVVLFDKVDVDTTNVGLVTINGKNLDAELKNVTNGAGKSLLFNPFANLLFDSVPLATAKRGAKKDFFDKESKATFRLASNGKVLEVTQTGNSYSLTLDGEEIKKLTEGKQDTAKEWIKKFCPVTEEEFYSFVYIHTQASHPFQRAKPSERLAYITKVFGLDVYDRLRTHFNKLLSEAKDRVKVVEIYAEDLRQSYSVLESLTYTNTSKYDKRVSTLESRLNDLRVELTEAEIGAKTFRQAQSILTKLEAIGVIKSPKRELRELEEKNSIVKAWERYTVQVEEYEKRKKGLENRVAKLKTKRPKYDLDELNGDCDAMETVIKSRRRNIEQLEDIEAELTALLKSKPAKPKMSEDDAHEEIEVSKRTIKMCQSLADEAECPTCGHDLDPKHLAKLQKRAEAAKEEAGEALRYYAFTLKRNNLLEEKEALSIQISKQDKVMSDIMDKYDNPEEGLLEVLAQAENQNEMYQNWIRAKRELEELQEPEPVPSCDMTREEIRERGRTLERYIDLRDQLSALGDVPESDTSEDVERIREEIEEIQPRLKKAADLSSKYKISNERYSVTKSRIEELESKLEDLGDALEEKKCLELLYKAYSNTKLKLIAADTVLKALENELNALAPLVFPEPVTFELGTNKQGVYALAHFKTGKRKAADIYTLSGAESNCFRLLFALAILVFVPTDRRPNFMILDEPESNCGDSVRKHMINEFLPKLQSVVPNIFWITPLDTDMFGGAQQWTVIKKGGKSKLEIR